MRIEPIINDEAERRRLFPVAAKQAFFGHAGVSPLPAAARDAIVRYAEQGATQRQESPWFAEQVKRARRLAAQLIGADEREIALLGPTSLGLNLVAHGLDWQPGDQVVFYRDDYPANVYCWMGLARRGVEPIAMTTDQLGVITWDDVEPRLTDRTRLVSLASCHFVSGYQVDVDGIGRRLHERGVLFCVDGIQTLGARPVRVDHIDFLAADSHKWLLGPNGAGLFYVSREMQDRLHPALLGSWNVRSPRFIAQDEVKLESGGRRYEPGTLNGPGIVGMAASMELLLNVGVEHVAARLLELRHHLIGQMVPLGFELRVELPDAHAGGIVTFRHPSADLPSLHTMLTANDVAVSLRHDRAGTELLRFSPHFYNTFEELDRVVALLRDHG